MSEVLFYIPFIFSGAKIYLKAVPSTWVKIHCGFNAQFHTAWFHVTVNLTLALHRETATLFYDWFDIDWQLIHFYYFNVPNEFPTLQPLNRLNTSQETAEKDHIFPIPHKMSGVKDSMAPHSPRTWPLAWFGWAECGERDPDPALKDQSWNTYRTQCLSTKSLLQCKKKTWISECNDTHILYICNINHYSSPGFIKAQCINTLLCFYT